MHLCIWMHAFMYMNACIYVYECMHLCERRLAFAIRIVTQMYMYVRMYVSMCTPSHTHMYWKLVRNFNDYIHAYIHAYIHTCFHTRAKESQAKMEKEAVENNKDALVKTVTASNFNDFVHTWVCMCVCICMCVYIYIYIHICMYVYIYIYIYICTHSYKDLTHYNCDSLVISFLQSCSSDPHQFIWQLVYIHTSIYIYIYIYDLYMTHLS
jgi:hypothetical protein